MHAYTALRRAASLIAAAVIAVGLSGAAQAATDFAGTYRTTDTFGRPRFSRTQTARLGGCAPEKPCGGDGPPARNTR